MTWLPYLMFLLSGAAALLFETLWFRQAGLALGNTIRASSLVLAGFMGGLALGNAVVARVGHRWRRPVRLYGLLELAIAATGVALVYGLPALTPALAALFARFVEEPFRLDALRLAVAFPLLLIPSTAMGLTLPLLAGALHRRDPHFGRVLGRLYGWNTIGAVVGALAGEAGLIAWLGVRGASFVAAALNLAAASLAFTLARRTGGEAAAPAAAAAAAPEARPRLSRRALALLAAAFVLGATLLALEVVWFRLLLLFLHASSLVFAIMLAVVLAGIGTGSLLAGRALARWPGLWRGLPAIALGSGCLCLAGYFLLGSAPRLGSPELPWVDPLLLGATLMFPVSLLSGALFTLLGVALLREAHGATRATGLLTLANTVGAMLGSLAGGFLLLPHLGIERSIELLAASYAMAAVLLVLGGLRPETGRASAGFLAPGTLLLLALAFFPSGVAAQAYLQAPLGWFFANEQAQVVETREGLTETLTYLRSDRFGEPVYYRLITNGHSMSGTMLSADRYMKLFVYLPVALHPDPKSALLICFGVGGTAKALTDTASFETIDVVDTSRDVLELSRIPYPDPRTNPLSDPRVSVHVEDGRFFLQTTRRRFDLITGEPPPPKNAGIVNLYTREYFALIRERLEEGGFATYWLPVHAMSDPDVQVIVRAFCAVFDDCTLWDGAGLNWVLMGTRHARGPVSEERFTAQWRDPRVAPELRALGFERPEQLGATFLADADALRARTAASPVLVDDYPNLLTEDRRRGLSGTPAAASGIAASYADWLDIGRAARDFAQSPVIARLWPPALREATLPYFAWQALLRRARLGELGPPADELPALHRILTGSSLETLPLWYLGTDDDEERAAQAARAKGRHEVMLDYLAGAAALARRDWDAAAAAFASAQQRGRDRDLVYYRVYALAMAGRTDEAREVGRQAGIPRPGLPGDAAFARFAQGTLHLELGPAPAPPESAPAPGPR